MSDTAKRSVYKGVLYFGGVQIPVSVYKGSDIYEVPGNLYHFECGGKVHYKMECEDHPDAESIVTYSAIEIGGKLVPIDSQVRNDLLDRNCGFHVESVQRLADLSSFMSTNQVVPCGFYEVAPNRDSIAARLTGRHDDLFTLFQRLAAKKKFLVCTISLMGCKRLAILLPGGQLYPLHYAEEIREFTQVKGIPNPDIARLIDGEIDRLTKPYSIASIEPLVSKVVTWMNSHLPKKRAPRTNPKKNAKALVDA